METFSWPNHTLAVRYPDSGYRATLGGSYQFAAEPVVPDQREFVLRFEALQFFTQWDEANGLWVPDRTRLPEINLWLLDDFYRAHRTWKSFIYLNPLYGQVEVKFSTPLEIPHGTKGGNGVVQGIEVRLLEQP